MILKDLTIRGFGKFENHSLSFDDGINVIYGGNEAGKSTLHSFLRAMFFGMERARGRASKTDFYSHYLPWKNDSVYGGILRVEEEGHIYRIERNFRTSPTDLTIIDETEGAAVPQPEKFLSGLLGGISETAYMNTVSIGQLKSQTDSGMVDELKNYIANMNTSGNMALNISKAAAFLKEQKRSFEKCLQPEAARNYAANLSEIKRVETELASPEYQNRIPELEEKRAAGDKRRHELQLSREVLLEKAASGKQVLENAHFTTAAEIVDFEDSAEMLLDRMTNAAEKAASHGPFVFAILMLLCAAASTGIIFFAPIPDTTLYPPLYLPLKALLIPVLIVCLVLAILALRVDIARKAKLRKTEATYTSLVRGHFPELIPDSSDDEETDPEELFDRMMLKTAELRGLAENLEKDSTVLEALKQDLAAADQLRAETEEALEAQKKTQWMLEQRLEHLTNLKDEAAALKKAVAENDRLRLEIESIDLALETMTRLSTTIRDSFGLYLNKSASDLISGITGGIYDSLSIDQDLNIFLNTREKLVPLPQASSGTMDQVYLALRLAASDLLRGDSKPLPLFFDDSFVNYDEMRLRTALIWLADNFKKRQILIFSCHRREAQIFSANLCPYHLMVI